MRVFIFTIVIVLVNSVFGQKEKKYDEFFLNLYKKDSLKVEILSTAKYLKSFTYNFSNDTLYIDAILTIMKKKNFNTTIKLNPQVNYVNFNKEIYIIELNNTFVVPTYRLVKQTKP